MVYEGNSRAERRRLSLYRFSASSTEEKLRALLLHMKSHILLRKLRSLFSFLRTLILETNDFIDFSGVNTKQYIQQGFAENLFGRFVFSLTVVIVIE